MNRLLARTAAFSFAVLSGALALWACGPFLPNWLLTDGGRVLEAPTTWLRDALEPLPFDREPEPRPRIKAVVAGDLAPHRQTAGADLADLQSASSDRTVTARYAEVREAIARYGDAVVAWREDAAWNDNPPPRPAFPALKMPAGLSGELADYLGGAVAYHQGDLPRARAAWEKLLNRPAGERRNRSTWAAFMLGRSSVDQDPAAAVRWFERTRELATRDGFPDPLGLAAASLGWQAKAELGRQRPAEALTLYLRQMKTGDPTALQSIRVTARKLLEDPVALKAVAASEEARPIMTAYVLSRWDRVDYDGPLDAAPARKWLDALRAARVSAVPDADRLAWVCYRAGDFDAAGEWVRKAPDKPMARWIEAKLLLRAGKLAEAERVLQQVRLPARVAQEDDLFEAYDNGVQPPVNPRVLGDSGASRLARGEYTQSLGLLLLAGYWSDAAYVAERVLTADELRAYAEKEWPAALASHRPDDYGDDWTILFGGLVSPSRERMAYDLRYLAGRRMVREGRYAEAEAFLPKTLGLPLKALAGAVAEGRDAKRPAAERARSLFKAACLLRYQGLALAGSELEPDWFLFEAQYELDPYADARATGKLGPLAPTTDEKARAKRSLAAPAKRFHYRYRGMALAQEAAALLPDGSEEKARMLTTAGNWVEGRDPQAARPLYDALQSCCANTEAGRRAKRANAISNLEDTCPAETKAREEGR